MLKKLSIISYDDNKESLFLSIISTKMIGDTVLVHSSPEVKFYFFESDFDVESIVRDFYSAAKNYCDIVICDEYIEGKNFMVIPDNTSKYVCKIDLKSENIQIEDISIGDGELVLEDLDEETLNMLNFFSQEDEYLETMNYEDKIDFILDKINISGIDSLTEDEKKILYEKNK